MDRRSRRARSRPRRSVPPRVWIVAAAALVGGGACDAGPYPPNVVPYEHVPAPHDASDDPDSLTREQLALHIDFVEFPEKLTLGSDLRYVVELRNDGDDPVPLQPCPVYYQAWGESGFSVSRTSYLNCDEAPSEIPPGGAVRFEMKLPIEDEEAVHVDGGIVWYLGSPWGELRTDVHGGSGPDVVRPRP